MLIGLHSLPRSPQHIFNYPKRCQEVLKLASKLVLIFLKTNFHSNTNIAHIKKKGWGRQVQRGTPLNGTTGHAALRRTNCGKWRERGHSLCSGPHAGTTWAHNTHAAVFPDTFSLLTPANFSVSNSFPKCSLPILQCSSSQSFLMRPWLDKCFQMAWGTYQETKPLTTFIRTGPHHE